jgi:hypothetical protein
MAEVLDRHFGLRVPVDELSPLVTPHLDAWRALGAH